MAMASIVLRGEGGRRDRKGKSGKIKADIPPV
jgi:hypothetical protein